MSLTKTIGGDSTELVAVNGNGLHHPQVIEDIIDAIALGAGPAAPTITVAAQSGTHRDASIQLKDALGVALAVKAMATVWISDSAAAAPTASAPAGGVTVQTGVNVASITANKVFQAVSGSDGIIVMRLTDATGSINTTWYVNVAFGGSVVSAAVNITNA